MFRTLAALSVVIGLTTPASAKLELRDIKAMHDVHGPERSSLEVSDQRDQVFFRFTITGIRTDASGSINAEIVTKLSNAAGKGLVAEKTVKDGLLFGGDSAAGIALVKFGPDAPPGEYLVTVTVRDLIGDESASFERKLTLKEPTFAIILLQMSYDKEGTVAAPPGGVLGQTVYFRLVVGLDRSQKRMHVVMRVETFDAAGKESLLPKPVQAKVEHNDPERVARTEAVSFNGALGLNRVGEFRLRITITDEVTEKKVVFETPVRVTAP